MGLDEVKSYICPFPTKHIYNKVKHTQKLTLSHMYTPIHIVERQSHHTNCNITINKNLEQWQSVQFHEYNIQHVEIKLCFQLRRVSDLHIVKFLMVNLGWILFSHFSHSMLYNRHSN